MRNTKTKPFMMANKQYENIIQAKYFANSKSPKRKGQKIEGLNFIAGLPENMGTHMHFSYKKEVVKGPAQGNHQMTAPP
jgi:hypothetical protein